MKIEIKQDGAKWLLLLFHPGARGPQGFTNHFSSKFQARMAAEGIMFCFSRIKVSVYCNYLNRKPVVHSAKNEAFITGIAIFYKKIFYLPEEVSNKAIQALLSEL
ncbi:MAG: hypothetical protein WC671_01095 [Candidatus Paceibacterota bacterium]|jgi:hypothetical protein